MLPSRGGDSGVVHSVDGRVALYSLLAESRLSLKHAFNESDESLLERWVENPCWQFFCGLHTFQHELPFHPASLVKWRQRMRAERLEALLQETIAQAQREQQVTAHELQQVNIDTKVLEKNITHPTDSKLLRMAIVKLAKAAQQRGLRLRQTYTRVAKRAMIQASRYARAKRFQRMRRELRRLRTWLGRVLQDIRRQQPAPDQPLDSLLTLCEPLAHHAVDLLHTWPIDVVIQRGHGGNGSLLQATVALVQRGRCLLFSSSFAAGVRGPVFRK
jgi:Transposase domain (DUF772)